MKRSKRDWLGQLLIATVVAVICCGSAQGAELLTNGGFESEPNFGSGISGDSGYSALTGSQIPGWTIASGHAATVHNTAIYPFISGNYSINMDGEGFMGHNADLYQDFATGLGQSYNFSFDWQGWQNNAPNTQLEVSIVDLMTNAVLYSGFFSFSSTLHHETASFLGTGNNFRLELQESPESGINDNQFIVDNFSVDAVPEPSTVALLVAAGAVSVARFSRARRKTIR
jgi:hypothetical protein